MSKRQPKVGDEVKDNDPRGAHRKGVIEDVLLVRGEPYAIVRWNTGRRTTVACRRIGRRGKTAISFLDEVTP